MFVYFGGKLPLRYLKENKFPVEDIQLATIFADQHLDLDNVAWHGLEGQVAAGVHILRVCSPAAGNSSMNYFTLKWQAVIESCAAWRSLANIAAHMSLITRKMISSGITSKSESV